MSASASRSSYIGHYVLRGVLGEGAIAVVYRAEHRATRRPVAIKMLRRSNADDPEARARLSLEARVLGRVRNPHLVDAIDAGTLESGAPFLVLEQLQGGSVARHIADARLPIAASVEIARSVLEALTPLHAAGFVHRDIKPSNVMLHREDGHVTTKLIDLGVCLDAREPSQRTARQTQAGSWVGSPCYMAPEQLDGRPIDARTDVYGVGAMLYECLTGEPPHTGMHAGIVAARVLSDRVEPVRDLRPDCPRALATLVMRALEKDPARRPTGADDLRAMLDAVARSEGLACAASLDALPEPSDAEATPSDGDRGTTRRSPMPVRDAVPIFSMALVVALVLIGGVGAILAAEPMVDERAPTAASTSPSATATTNDPGYCETPVSPSAVVDAPPPAPASPPARAAVARRVRPRHARPARAKQDPPADVDASTAPEPLAAPPVTVASWEELEADVRTIAHEELAEFDPPADADHVATEAITRQP